MENRPWHKLTSSKAPGDLINTKKVKYCIRPNYRTCSYKHTVKEFSNLKDYNQCTFIYFFMKKTYVVGTHLNCLDKSRQFKQVSTTYDSIKKTENKIA